MGKRGVKKVDPKERVVRAAVEWWRDVAEEDLVEHDATKPPPQGTSDLFTMNSALSFPLAVAVAAYLKAKGE